MEKGMIRQSNMELLRIVSMIFVMVIHADFYSIPYSAPRWFVVIGADSGVNCFVLISGYFGIHPKIRSFSSFIFQILFFIFIGNMIHVGGNHISYDVTAFSWFVNAYIALYVFAPVLNAFAEKASKKQFRRFLILWAAVEFVLGYQVDYLKFERGYSFQAFILLYMTARYIRIHGGGIFSLRRHYDLLLYILFTMISAVLMFASESVGKPTGGAYYLRAYNSPVMILASIYLTLFFKKIRAQNAVINRIGKSAYAAFLLHSVVYDWYKETCHVFYIQNHYIVASVYSIVLIFSLFIIALLFDQIRILVWEKVLTVAGIISKQIRHSDK